MAKLIDSWTAQCNVAVIGINEGKSKEQREPPPPGPDDDPLPLGTAPLTPSMTTGAVQKNIFADND